VAADTIATRKRPISRVQSPQNRTPDRLPRRRTYDAYPTDTRETSASPTETTGQPRPTPETRQRDSRKRVVNEHGKDSEQLSKNQPRRRRIRPHTPHPRRHHRRRQRLDKPRPHTAKPTPCTPDDRRHPGQVHSPHRHSPPSRTTRWNTQQPGASSPGGAKRILCVVATNTCSIPPSDSGSRFRCLTAQADETPEAGVTQQAATALAGVTSESFYAVNKWLKSRADRTPKPRCLVTGAVGQFVRRMLCRWAIPDTVSFSVLAARR